MGQDAEWVEIYRGLKNILSPYGKDDAFGEGDYWIMDDNWGNLVHKIHVSNINIITEDLIDSIQHLLARYATNWEVRVIVDAPRHFGPHPQMGMRIFANSFVHEIPENYAEQIPFLSRKRT